MTWVGAQAQEAANSPPSGGGFRILAPGVIITIPPATKKNESYSRHDLPRLLAKNPKFGERRHQKDPTILIVNNLATGVRIPTGLDEIPTKEGRKAFHDASVRLGLPDPRIWALEFNFKPMRMIKVDVPRPGAKFDQKMIWYMVYYVRNVSKQPVKFIPRILLFTDRTITLKNGKTMPKIYSDRLIPTAIAPIRRREDPRRKFLDSVEISAQEIKPSSETEDNSVWGVATWEDVDPETDKFSVYIQGLTNAYRIESVTRQDDAGKSLVTWTYLRKTLKLNFWRPGDAFDESDQEIRYGQRNELEHEWVYK